MSLNEYLNGNYTFTPFITEIAVILQNPTQTLILSNLINKLPAYNKNADTKMIYGKEYHFSYDQNYICENEIGLPYITFYRNLKELNKKGYVTSFKGRTKNKLGYNTTYFLLDLDKIRGLFKQGCKLLGKPIKETERENKQSNIKPHPNNISKTKPPKFTKSDASEKYHKWIITALDTINKEQIKLNDNLINQTDFNLILSPIKGQLFQNNIKIIKDNNTNLWKIH